MAANGALSHGQRRHRLACSSLLNCTVPACMSQIDFLPFKCGSRGKLYW